MNIGAISIDGIASGLDTTAMLEQLAAIQRRPIQILTARKSRLQEQLAAFQSINASLTALRIAADALKTPARFTPNTAVVTDSSSHTHLAASAGLTAQQGSYEISVQQLAAAHKVASGQVADADEALGLSGDIRINGKVISVQESHTLGNLRDAINAAEAGVNATILQVGEGDYRLMLTARDTGAANAIDLVDANSTGILSGLGLLDGNASIKHAVPGGARSDGVASSALDIAQALGLVIPPAGTVFINGKAVSVNLAGDSLEVLRDRINATPDIGVTATIVSEETTGGVMYRLQIVGDSGTPMFEDDNNVLQALGILAEGIADERQAARDAVITVDGISVSRAGNAMDDVIGGVNLQLMRADPGHTLTLEVRPNLDGAIGEVRSFVQAYNQVVDMIAGAQSYDSETNTGGPLLSNMTVRSLEDALRRTVTGLLTVPGGDSTTLASVGITSDRQGKLSLDAAKLQSALEANPAAVAKLFGVGGVASDSQVQFVSASRDTHDSGAAGWAVHITRAAEQATASSAALAGGITATETLTFNGTQPIILTAGMSLEQARDHLNGWFGIYGLEYEASVSGDRLQIAHAQYGSNHGFSVASSLDRGAGGTDLGGAAAGQAEQYAGVDVAGTINGEAATGRGRHLTGAEGNATTAGLVLRITAQAPGDLGAITVFKGAAARLSDYIQLATAGEHAAMTQGAAGITAGIQDMDREIERMEERVEMYVERMRARFTAMERTVGQAQALQHYMTGQINALPRNYVDRLR